MKQCTIFRASPRPEGNTNSLTDVVSRTMKDGGCAVREFDLYKMNILPCLACRKCQEDWEHVTCAREDDLGKIFPEIMESDLLILATPVYSWYCTPPMKAMLDRLVYAMNMYYGEERGPSIWKGKQVVLITTCGYPPEQGSDLLEEGIRRYCKHSQLIYRGMLCERHLGYNTTFMDDAKAARAAAFARQLLENAETQIGETPVCPRCSQTWRRRRSSGRAKPRFGSAATAATSWSAPRRRISARPVHIRRTSSRSTQRIIKPQGLEQLV